MIQQNPGSSIDSKITELEKQVALLKNSQVTGQSFMKLKDSMIKMKDNQIQKQKEQIDEMKRQLEEKAIDSKKNSASNQESVEILKAKVHSLNYLLAQSDQTITMLKTNYLNLEKQNIEKLEECQGLTKQIEESKNSNTILQELIRQQEEQASQQIALLRKQREDLVEERNQKEKNLQLCIDKLEQENQIKQKSVEDKLQQLLNENQEKNQIQLAQINEKNLQIDQHQEEIKKLNKDLVDQEQRYHQDRSKLSAQNISQQEQKPQSMSRYLEQQMQAIQNHSLAVKKHQEKEIELTLRICALQEENSKLRKAAEQLYELDEAHNKIQILEEQLNEALSVNKYITGYYQQQKVECQQQKNLIQQQELQLTLLKDQYIKLQEDVPKIQNDQQLKTLFNQIHLRSSILIKKYIQSSQTQIDQHILIKNLNEIQDEMLKERQNLDKIMKSFTKLLHSNDNSKNFEKLFLYIEEQIQKHQEVRLIQKEAFEEIKLSIKRPYENPIIDSLKSQIDLQSEQIDILKQQTEDQFLELEKFKARSSKLEKDLDKKRHLLLDLRSALIIQIKDSDKVISENSLHKQEVKNQKLVNEALKQKLKELQEQHNYLVEYFGKLNVVGNEYQKANIDQNMTKMINSLSLQIKEFQVKESQYQEKIFQLEQHMNIFKEDYSVLKSQLLNQAFEKHKDEIMVEIKPKEQEEKEAQTQFEVDTALYDFLANEYSDINSIFSQYQTQIEALMELFEGIANQDETIQQFKVKEQEYQDKQKQIDEQLVFLRDVTEKQKQKIETQHQFILSQKEKMKNQQLQQPPSIATQIQQAQQQAQPVQSRIVMTQQQSQEQAKLLKQIEDIQKEKEVINHKLHETENSISRIRQDASAQMKLLSTKNQELKREIDKLQEVIKNNGQTVENQTVMSANQVVGKLHNSLQKARNIIIHLNGSDELMEDIQSNQQ
ncbi:UNKNOWN [Stylonychia lemnae]|uniref:Uncharacterized protein n=1 Tax=Stylonychia lemnae TaxID=5949 RepID=A0A078APP2_STYLE|nr:UNKNOWN [Stylonychia lemnae]|eukprot:CDW83931.1 UNKNOWN [Stylonychia lemnae]